MSCWPADTPSCSDPNNRSGSPGPASGQITSDVIGLFLFRTDSCLHRTERWFWHARKVLPKQPHMKLMKHVAGVKNEQINATMIHWAMGARFHMCSQWSAPWPTWEPVCQPSSQSCACSQVPIVNPASNWKQGETWCRMNLPNLIETNRLQKIGCYEPSCDTHLQRRCSRNLLTPNRSVVHDWPQAARNSGHCIPKLGQGRMLPKHLQTWVTSSQNGSGKDFWPWPSLWRHVFWGSSAQVHRHWAGDGSRCWEHMIYIKLKCFIP